MLAGPEPGQRHFEMGGDRRGNYNGVNVGIGGELAPVLKQPYARVPLARSCKRSGRVVRDARQQAALAFGDAARQVRPPVAIPDETDLNHTPPLPSNSPKELVSCSALTAFSPLRAFRLASRSRTSPMIRAGTPTARA